MAEEILMKKSYVTEDYSASYPFLKKKSQSLENFNCLLNEPYSQ